MSFSWKDIAFPLSTALLFSRRTELTFDGLFVPGSQRPEPEVGAQTLPQVSRASEWPPSDRSGTPGHVQHRPLSYQPAERTRGAGVGEVTSMIDLELSLNWGRGCLQSGWAGQGGW